MKNVKILFSKGGTSVTLDIKSNVKTIETIFQANLEYLNNEYFIEIPDFNISTSTKEKNDAKERIHDSVLSFLNYRLKKQGIDSFIITMFQLGFEIKDISKVFKKENFVNHKESQQISDKFVFA